MTEASEQLSAENSSLLAWVLAGVSAIITVLTGTVSWFYRERTADQKALQDYLKAKVDKLEIEANACKKDREDLRVEVTSMRVELRVLTERLGEKCPVAAPVVRRSKE